MRESKSESTEMSSVEFVQYALQHHVAPPRQGPVKARLRSASRKLGWAYSRVRDAWYADPRIRISADELRTVEQLTGLRYGRQELKEIDAYIARSTALLEGQDEDFNSAFADALRAFYRALHRPRIGG